MKGNRIDELFRNGLESHKTAAPASAWDKIDAALPQKSKKGAYFWLSIAASIILLATISWLAFNNQSTPAGMEQEVLSEQQPTLDESSKAQNNEQPEPVIPSTENTEEVEPIEPVQDKIVQLPSLVAQASTQQSPAVENNIQEAMESAIAHNSMLKIDLIEPTAFKPRLLVHNISRFSASINTAALMEDVTLTEEEFNAESENKKRFGLLSSIVSVAKGVNSGTKALSEMRKSKNEFVSKDLKYGTKTDASSEDIEDGPEQKQ